MKKFFVFAFLAFGVFGILPAFAQSSNDNDGSKNDEKSYNKFYFDLFLGLSLYGEKMPKKVDQTITVSGESISIKDVTWGLENTKATFFDIGLSITYLFTQRFGAYLDVSYLNANSNLKTEFDFVAGMTMTPEGIAEGLLGGTFEVDGDKTGNMKTNGVLFSIGPTFNLIKSKNNLLLLTPKFNLQYHTIQWDSEDDGFVIKNSTTGAIVDILPASYNITYKNTEIGVGLIAEYKGIVDDHWYFTVKAGINFDFYQYKTVTEEITIKGLRNKIIFETEVNSKVSNFSFVPVVGVGYSF